MEEGEYQEPPPPNSERVARRAIILSVVCCRGIIDSDPDPGAADLWSRTKSWFEGLEIGSDVSGWESGIIATAFGHLSQRDRVNAGWLSEGLVVLTWALGKMEMPDFDTQCDPQETANNLGFLLPRQETILLAPTLRSSDELSDYNEFVYNVHWRVRDHRMRIGQYDFESLARKAWGDPVIRYGLKLADKDIALAGAPLAQAPEPAFRGLTSITQERHRASNWLIGYASEDFYEVTTDT